MPLIVREGKAVIDGFTFVYYEVAEKSQRVDQAEKDTALECPAEASASCIGLFEKFENARSERNWENTLFILEDADVEGCKQTCVDNVDCVSIDYDFLNTKCYLKSYNLPVIAQSDYIHYRLIARKVPSNDEGGLSKTNLIIIISCSVGGFILFILACLDGLKIYKNKQQDLLDGMTPKEFVLHNGGDGVIELISDEEYQKDNLANGGTSSETKIGKEEKEKYLATVATNQKKTQLEIHLVNEI
eukprot:Awhi_evm4s15800